VGAALALLIAGCGSAGAGTGGVSTTRGEASPGRYLNMQYLQKAFQAQLERENPEAFVVEVICGRTGPDEATCNVREDEQTKGYPIRLEKDGAAYALTR
jgi:hypothetical protein